MSEWAWAVQRYINSFLPFATPGTPLYQDVIHTIILCTILYYIPVVAEKFAQARARKTGTASLQDAEQERAAGLRAAPEVNAGMVINDNHELAGEEHMQDAIGDPPPRFLPAVPLPNGPERGDEAAAGLAGAPAAGGAGDDARPAPARRAPRDNVGTKKAKSLARKEQRRAHFEFVREQAAHERALEQSTREQREAEYAAMVAARRPQWEAAQRKLDESAAMRREARARRERAERDRRLRCEEVVRARLAEERCIDVQDVAEEVWEVDETERSWEDMQRWVVNLVRAMPGVLGKKPAADGKLEITMLTAAGYIVRVDEEVMGEVYAAVERMAKEKRKSGQEPKVSLQETGSVLEQLLIEKSY